MTVLRGDCLKVMAALRDNSVDAIVTDPPYFKVKNEAWDRQWDKPAEFVAWLGTVADQWQRVLKPNGSLYCFASPKMAARVEVMLAERFNVLNSVVWVKPEPFSQLNRAAGNGGRISKESLRSYYPNTERIIFAEHYGADNMAKGEAGYAAKCDELRGFVFEPLRAYLDGERRRAGVGKAECNQACGFSLSAGGMASRHYFSRSQWALPTGQHYAALQRLFNQHGGEYLRRDYEELRRDYEELRRDYEELRRPFSVTADVPYTDTWTFATVQAYPGKHPCEKPQALLRHIITTSTRPGAVVLDTFAGTGATGVACMALGRRFIGIEQHPGYAATARHRVSMVQTELMEAA